MPLASGNSVMPLASGARMLLMTMRGTNAWLHCGVLVGAIQRGVLAGLKPVWETTCISSFHPLLCLPPCMQADRYRNQTAVTSEDLMYWDYVHPYGNTGHRRERTWRRRWSNSPLRCCNCNVVRRSGAKRPHAPCSARTAGTWPSC